MVDASGNNLVFLVSAPRAGSTMLGAMLGTLPQAACPSEIWIQLLMTLFNSRGVHTDAVYDHDLALKAFLDVAGSDRAQHAVKTLALEIYNGLLADKPGSTVLVDKTPRYYHILDELADLWPQAKYVWVQRNPLDIVASCKDTWSISLDEQMGEIVTPHSFDTTLSFERLGRFFDGNERRRTIRYEDLVEDPSAALRTLCRDLGLPFAKGMLEYGKNRQLITGYRSSSFGDKKILEHSKPHRQSIGRWRQLLDVAEVRKVVTTLGRRCFVDQGYEPEFREACAFAGIPESAVDEQGSWRRNLEKAEGATAEGAASRHFAAAKTLRRQEDELQDLRTQLRQRADDIHELSRQSDEAKNARNLLEAQLADLQRNFAAAEVDRAAREQVIKRQGAEFTALQAEFDRRLRELKALYATAEAHKNERNLLQAQLIDLQNNFAAAEADRVTRGKVIEQQGAERATLHTEFDRRLGELKELYVSAESLKNERNLLLSRLADLQRNFDLAEADRLTRGKVIEQQGAELATVQAEFARRLTELEQLYVTAETLKNERNLLQAQLTDLQRNFAAAEADRVARGDVIEQQGKRTAELEQLVWLTEQDRDYWKKLAPPPTT